MQNINSFYVQIGLLVCDAVLLILVLHSNSKVSAALINMNRGRARAPAGRAVAQA